jgi:hypothetical protein
LRYFSIIPVPEFIDAPNNVKIGGSTFDEVECTNKHIKIKFNESYASENGYEREYVVVEFNVLPGIHSWIEENTPLELLWTASADFLESLGIDHNIYLFPEKPNGLETLLSTEDSARLYLPFQVRGANKTLFPNVFSMIPVDQKFLSPLETISEIPEDHIRNAMYTYYKNVVPTGDTSRFVDLMEVVVPEIEKVEERFRILTRIISPLVHYIVLKKDLSNSLIVSRVKDKNYSIEYSTSSKLSLKGFSERLVKKLTE